MNRPFKVGSSLVLVVVIMAGIIVVVFGASRLTLVQYNQANRDEDNIFALYAAKAGIEDGLLRFRFNRDTETTDGKVFRFDLTKGQTPGDSSGEVADSQTMADSTNYKPTDQYYDLKIKFRDKQIGSFSPPDSDNNPAVVKDDLVELTGFPLDWPTPYYLRYRFEFTDCVGNPSNQLVQIQQISETADPLSPVTYDQVTVRKPAVGTVVDSKDSSTNMLVRSDPGPAQALTSSIRLRAYGCSVKYAFATSNTDSGDGQGADNGPQFDNFKTLVTSTGYYGLAKRTLVAEVNRASGRLIDILDFNIYSGTGNIKP